MPDMAIQLTDVRHAREILRPYLQTTPLRHYPQLDAAFGGAARVLVKHENHQPTNSFKARNGIAAVAALSPEERARGVICATRGNHGQGVALGGQLLGAEVTVCVPLGNNVEKNEAMRALGAHVIEEGANYDEAAALAGTLGAERGLTLVHSSNNPHVLAAAGTLTLEILEQAPRIDALVVALGGGSQAVGAIAVTKALAPHVPVYAVQAERAPAQYESIKAGRMVHVPARETLADGLATSTAYALTFDTLCRGLAGVVTVSEDEIAEAMRIVIRTTHNLLEGGAGAAFAGLWRLRSELAGKTVAVVLSGANVDQATLRRVLGI